MSETKEQEVRSMDQDEPKYSEVSSAKALPLQPLWMDDVRGWLALAEITFDLQKTTSSRQKYLQVISSIPSLLVQTTIPDVLREPPTENHYEHLKKILLTRLAPSDERQLEALLSGQDIGDRKPSEALRHIENLAGNNFGIPIIRSLWTRKMHELIRIALAAQPDSASLSTLAEIADRMYETIRLQQGNVHAYEAPNHPLVTGQARRSNREPNHSDRHRTQSPSSFASRLTRLEQIVERLNLGAPTQPRGRHFSRSLSKSRSRSRSRSRFRPSQNSHTVNQRGICFYHEKYKDRAHKCIKPCQYDTLKSKDPKNL